MDIATIAQLGVGLIAGAVGKKAGKSPRVGGDIPAQKVLAPLAAVVGSTAAAGAVSPGLPAEQLLLQGGQVGAYAIAAHIVIKSLIQLVREIRALKGAAA